MRKDAVVPNQTEVGPASSFSSGDGRDTPSP